MIVADIHTHTSFSTDGISTPEEMVQRAIQLGLKHYCFTDHYDAFFPGEPGEFTFSIAAYLQEHARLRERYGDQIEILTGVELGLRNEPDMVDKTRDFYAQMLQENNFDFCIGSTHVLEYMDPYYPEYWKLHDGNEGMRLYLESILDNLQNYSGIQAYGHLDYLLRYVPAEHKESLGDFRELYDAIVEMLLKKQVALEVNTAHYAKGGAYPHPGLFALTRYRERGGELLTIGSDAHKTEQVAWEFARTEQLLLSLGYRSYTMFKKQAPVCLPLG